MSVSGTRTSTCIKCVSVFLLSRGVITLIVFLMVDVSTIGH